MRQNNPGISFPLPPARWNEDERRFADRIRELMEQIRWQRAYPVGVVVLSTKEEKPFTFGEWESVTTGITGVNGWKRVR